MLRQLARSFHSGRSALQSSCKEGTPIKINILKAGKPIVAKKDEEYPDWLWGLLDKDLQMQQLKEESLFKYKRKLVKKANVEKIKMQNFMSKK